MITNEPAGARETTHQGAASVTRGVGGFDQRWRAMARGVGHSLKGDAR